MKKQMINFILMKVIGRIPFVGITAAQMERYCLRLLLFRIPGPKSYEDLKTVDGKVMETFQATCFALGFLEDDKENDKVMEDASLICFGNMLIDCFVNLLLFSTPAQPKEFYDRHKESIIAEFLKSESVMLIKLKQRRYLPFYQDLSMKISLLHFLVCRNSKLKRICQH